MSLIPHEFKPETEEEKKKRKAEIEKNLVFRSVSFPEARTRIAELLFKTAYFTKMPINKDNPKILGGIMFWLDTNEEGVPMLMYNKHPSKWNRDAVITELEVEEHHLLFSGRFRQ